MPEPFGNQLRELLSQQVEAASKEAVHSGGQVSAEQVDALSRLNRLVDLHQAMQPRPLRKRWPVVVVLGITLLIVSLLLFARVAETEIEADLALSEVKFLLPWQQGLTEAMDLSTLGASGFREIKLPQAFHKDAQTPLSDDGGEASLSLSTVSEGKHHGTITLAPLKLPAKTQVRVTSTGVPREYRLSLQGTNTELSADVNGQVRAGFSSGGSQQVDFRTPDVAVMQTGENEVDLDLTLLGPGTNNFSSQLSVSDLSFFHVAEIRDPESVVARRVSTILSGTLNFESLNGLERKVRPGEMLQFDQSQVEIRTLRLQDDHIELKFYGRVRGMSAGSGESRRSLMPTWFEWLRAQHSLSLLWGTALYLLGLLAGVLRWWRRAL
jgi:hypothetical protein